MHGSMNIKFVSILLFHLRLGLPTIITPSCPVPYMSVTYPSPAFTRNLITVKVFGANFCSENQQRRATLKEVLICSNVGASAYCCSAVQ
jgi:hypothetical protein